MASVPRERFVPEDLASLAYEDRALPVEAGQTISQPFIVAAMAEAMDLEPSDRVLEIGAGTGYAAAVFASIASEVIAIERHRILADIAAQNLKAVGITSVTVIHADGTRGHPEVGPYDAVCISAGTESVPSTIVEQLAVGGRLVVPVGPADKQELLRYRKLGDGLTEPESLGPVSFVPLIADRGEDD